VGTLDDVGAPDLRRLHSAILVPVPEAEALVGAWRCLHDPFANAGVPAHITLLVPWIPPAYLTPDHLRQLDKLLADERPFEYTLERVCWFGKRVLWLAPNPSNPFVELTERVAREFDTPPWAGEFDEIVPHLTVGHATDDAELSEVADALDVGLPIRCTAKEIDVMCGDGRHWKVKHRVVLG
jgi:2'-5' RNA ligase